MNDNYIFEFCYQSYSLHELEKFLDNYELGCLSYNKHKNTKPLILYIKSNQENLYFNLDRKSTRLNSSHSGESRMPSSA